MQARFTSVVAVIVLLASPQLCGWAWAQALSHRNPTGVPTPASKPASASASKLAPAPTSRPAPPPGVRSLTGRLEHNDERYVLVDDAGDEVACLIPRESLALDSYVGKAVQLSVREPLLRHEGDPRVWVDRIALANVQDVQGSRAPAAPSGHNSRSLLALAQYAEPIADPQLAIPGVPMPELTAPGSVSDDAAPGVAVPGLAVPAEESVTPCGRPGWIWAGADYLVWRTQGMYVPALVTTSPAGTSRTAAGVLGEPGTVVLFGDDDLFASNTNGARVYAGLYFDRQSVIGIEGDYLWLQSQTADFFASSNASGTPILARPFFNINPRLPLTGVFDPPAREDARLASFPGVIRGTIAIDASSQYQSMGLAMRTLLACESFCNEQRTAYSRVDMITGYRYMQLNDKLRIGEDLSTLDQLPLVSFNTFDQFNTHNQLHAIDVGANWQGGWQRLSLDLTIKTALGLSRQEVDIQGGTVIAQTGSSTAYTGGLLALPSNIGLHSRDRFAVVPELSAVAGFQITRHIRATLGYSFILWGSVVRAGDQIDRDINPDQLAPPITPLEGALRPAFAFHESTYWAQGVSAGIEGRW
jgi:hypothetical protein